MVGDPLTYVHWAQIIEVAPNARLPTMCAIREFVANGAFISYARISRTYSGVPPSMSTKFCAPQSRRTSRSSNQLNSTLRLISRPPRRSASGPALVFERLWEETGWTWPRRPESRQKIQRKQ